MLKELPAEVAEAVLDELRGAQALLDEAERMARAWAEPPGAAVGCPCGVSRPRELLTAHLLLAGERCWCVKSGVHTACVGHCPESVERARRPGS